MPLRAPLFFYARTDSQSPTAPMDTHHAGSVLSQVLLGLAAVIAVIDFQNIAQASPVLCFVLLLRRLLSVRLKGPHRRGSAPIFIILYYHSPRRAGGVAKK